MTDTTTVFTDIDEIMPGIIADRRWLHENPELGFQEEKTAGFVRQRIEGSLRPLSLPFAIGMASLGADPGNPAFDADTPISQSAATRASPRRAASR